MDTNLLRLNMIALFVCLGLCAVFALSLEARASVTPLLQFTGTNGSIGGALTTGNNGFIYGTTATGGANNLGTIFRIMKNGSSFKVLHSFSGTDGDAPNGPLLLASDGLLYGTTAYGGHSYTSSTQGQGTLFSISLAGTKFKLLESFSTSGGPTYPSSGLEQDESGVLYGTYGTSNYFEFFSYDPITDLVKSIADPVPNYYVTGFVIGSDGLLYFTTINGGSTTVNGSGGDGALYSMATDGSGLEAVHNFGLSDDVAGPTDLIQGSDGLLYGTALGFPGPDNQGPDLKGTAWKIATDGSGYTTLHTFKGADGDEPLSMSFGSDGALYGTAAAGGPNGIDPVTGLAVNKGGVLFRLGTAGGEFSLIGALGTPALGAVELPYLDYADHNSLLYVSPTAILGCTYPYPPSATGDGAVVSASTLPSVPYITSLSPTSVTGDQTSTLTVAGGDFNKTSQVFINGNALTTTYVSPIRLTAAVEASDVPAGDAYAITVNAPNQPQASDAIDLFVPDSFALGQVTLTKNPQRGGLNAQIQLVDQSSYPADNISLPSSVLGTTRGSKPSPNTLGSVAPGSPATFTTYFAGSFPSGEQLVLEFGFTQEANHVSLSTTVTTP